MLLWRAAQGLSPAYLYALSGYGPLSLTYSSFVCQYGTVVFHRDQSVLFFVNKNERLQDYAALASTRS